jgi:hypothetical protein
VLGKTMHQYVAEKREVARIAGKIGETLCSQIVELLDEYHSHQRTVAELRKLLTELGIPDPDH